MLLKDYKKFVVQRPCLICFVLVLITYMVCAFCKDGYYHPDEHFQILEFANYKLGKTDGNRLPWEFQEQIRSSFQPWIAYVFIHFFYFCKVGNPYVIALSLRVFTALFSIGVICFYLKKTISSFKNDAMPYICLSFFLWFLPFINTRFSSECWSGLFMLCGLALIEGKEKLSVRSGAMIGMCIGLAFLCRYQSALMTVGILGWLFFIKCERGKGLVAILLGCLLLIMAGSLLDCLFYGNYVFVPWNYFRANILHDAASHFGMTSIWIFIWQIIQKMYTPIGILIVVCYLYNLFAGGKDLVIWCITPLILVHLLIPHKELRFLFPVADLVPYLLMKVYAGLKVHYLKWTALQRYPVQLILTLLAIINGVALFASILSPTENGRIRIANVIYNRYGNRNSVIFISTNNSNPFKPYPFLSQSFYYPVNMAFYKEEDISEKEIIMENKPVLLVIRRSQLKNENIQTLLDNGFHLIAAGNYALINLIGKVYDENMASRDYLLYELVNRK